MKNRIRLVFAIVLLILATEARADWALHGASYLCDRTTGTFALQQTVETSENPGKTDAPEGFKALKDGVSTVRCQLGGVNITARVETFPPRESGMRAGSGSAFLHEMRIDGNQVAANEELGPRCISERCLTLVRIDRRQGKSRLQICHEIGDSGAATKATTSCIEKPLARKIR